MKNARFLRAPGLLSSVVPLLHSFCAEPAAVTNAAAQAMIRVLPPPGGRAVGRAIPRRHHQPPAMGSATPGVAPAIPRDARPVAVARAHAAPTRRSPARSSARRVSVSRSSTSRAARASMSRAICICPRTPSRARSCRRCSTSAAIRAGARRQQDRVPASRDVVRHARLRLPDHRHAPAGRDRRPSTTAPTATTAGGGRRAATRPPRVECWNGIRALDYLQSRPEVDPDRLAVTGISGGGAAVVLDRGRRRAREGRRARQRHGRSRRLRGRESRQRPLRLHVPHQHVSVAVDAHRRPGRAAAAAVRELRPRPDLPHERQRPHPRPAGEALRFLHQPNRAAVRHRRSRRAATTTIRSCGSWPIAGSTGI